MSVLAKQLQREGSSSLWLHSAPGDWRDADPLLGLQVLRRFQAYSGPLGGIVALLESTFESQGDIPWKNQRLSGPDQTEEASRTSVPLIFREINILELLLYLLIYRLFLEGQLGGCLTIG